MFNSCLTGLGAAVALAVLRLSGPIPTPITLDAERVLGSEQQCQVLFVGPSYVVAQIFPEIFDEAARQAGHPLRSCVFGGTGLRGVELRSHVEQLFSRPWPKLQLVVIDVTLGPEPRFDMVNWYQPRTIQWHTWQSARWIYAYHTANDWNVPARQLWGHLAHLGANYLNMGLGLENAPGLQLFERAVSLLSGAPLSVRVPHAISRYRDDLRWRVVRKKRQAADYARRVSRGRHARHVAELMRAKRRARLWIEDSLTTQLRQRARSRGVDSVLILAPVWRALRRPPQPDSASAPIVIDFNDPTRFPELYERKSRGRTQHVSYDGGVAYSKLLAREILARWIPHR